MNSRPAKNAIERRLDYLGGLWNEFARQKDARLLRWLTDEDGTRLLEVFFETRSDSADGVPDLFMRLTVPFAGPRGYAAQLTAAFREMYEEARETLAGEGIDDSWKLEESDAKAPGITAFTRCCAGFRRHYDGLMENLVIVLQPQQIASPFAWAAWLRALVNSDLPGNVRLMVIDRADAPMLDELANSLPGLVVTVRPELDMPEAIAELVSKAGGSGPGVEFRRLFVELTRLAEKGNLPVINRKAQAALEIANREKWPALAVAVQSLVAAVHLRAGRTADAVTSYRAAAQSAEAAGEQRDPAGAKLLVQARFGEAAALLYQGSFAEAAQVYEQTAPVAQEAGESLMVLEAWRMAGYCHEQARNTGRAWLTYNRALDVAEKLEPETRQHSTLPYAGQGLLRVATAALGSSDADKVRARMRRLAGRDWEQQTEAR